MKSNRKKKPKDPYTAGIERALRRAARTARKLAKMHGAPVSIWRDGKVVAEKPRPPLSFQRGAQGG